MSQNLFLDFLNRDSRELYGMMDWSDADHARALVEAINVAAFLCEDYCVIPPGFIVECSLAQKAIAKQKDYFRSGLIRLSMREDSLDAYFEKKTGEYRGHEARYSGLFDPTMKAFFKGKITNRVSRDRVIGDRLVDLWENGPDTPGFVKSIIATLGLEAATVDAIRRIPRRLRGENQAITWEAISTGMGASERTNPLVRGMRRVVQHLYFLQHLESQGLTIITGLPFAKYDFGLAIGRHGFDYGLLRLFLKTIRCWDLIVQMSAKRMEQLRFESGYQLFRAAFVAFGDSVESSSGARAALGIIGQQTLGVCRPMLSAESHANGMATGTRLKSSQTADAISSIGEILRVASEKLSNVELHSPTPRSVALATVRRSRSWEVSSMPNDFANAARTTIPVAIYCALIEEREYLAQRWGLTAYENTGHWSGEVGGTKLLLYTSNQMGRVPAALSTMKFLLDFDPRLLLVLGIAGGFKKEGVTDGDVLVPQIVADLATRKIYENDKKAKAEFRPQPHNVNDKLLDFLNSSRFDRTKWSAETAASEKWRVLV